MMREETAPKFGKYFSVGDPIMVKLTSGEVQATVVELSKETVKVKLPDGHIIKRKARQIILPS